MYFTCLTCLQLDSTVLDQNGEIRELEERRNFFTKGPINNFFFQKGPITPENFIKN
jgi:hypothetical protein